MDAQGGVINGAGGNQNQIVGTTFVTEAMSKLHDNIRPGDAYMNNSPYYGIKAKVVVIPDATMQYFLLR